MTFANQRFGRLVCVANGNHLLRGMNKNCGTPKLKRSDIFLYSDQDEAETSLSRCSDTYAYKQLSVSGPCENFEESSSQNNLDSFSSSVRTYMPRA